MEKNSRLDYIDLAKGVVILLVVAGHIIEGNFYRAEKEPLHVFIYAFHMPLFFLLSGYVAGLTQKRLQGQSFGKWLWRKVHTLLIPYFVWKLLVYPFIDSTSNMVWNLDTLFRILFVNPKEGGAWFLLSLFCLQVVCYPVLRYKKVYAWIAPSIIVTLGVLFSGSFYYANIYFYASFLAGFLFFQYQKRLFTSSISTLAALCFFFSAIIYPNPLLLTLSAAIVLLYACIKTQEMGGGNWLYSKMTLIGQYTMAIYLLHYLLLFHIQRIDVSDCSQTAVFAIVIIVSFFVALVCFGIAKVIALFPMMNLLLFGKKSY